MASLHCNLSVKIEQNNGTLCLRERDKGQHNTNIVKLSWDTRLTCRGDLGKPY